MLDKTIDNALLALRKNLIREGGEGLQHVEALLRQRGVDLPRVMRPRRKDVARKGEMAGIILQALRNRPMRLTELVGVVIEMRPGADHERAYQRTTQALNKLQAKGLVKREGRVWLGEPRR